MTGLNSTNASWSSLDFFNFCIDGRLKESDIFFSERGTTNQKLSVLPMVFKNPSLSASMMGDYNNSHPLLYTEKVVGGVKRALGFKDVSGQGDYVPNTLLEGDIILFYMITRKKSHLYSCSFSSPSCTCNMYFSQC